MFQFTTNRFQHLYTYIYICICIYKNILYVYKHVITLFGKPIPKWLEKQPQVLNVDPDPAQSREINDQIKIRHFPPISSAIFASVSNDTRCLCQMILDTSFLTSANQTCFLQICDHILQCRCRNWFSHVIYSSQICFIKI